MNDVIVWLGLTCLILGTTAAILLGLITFLEGDHDQAIQAIKTDKHIGCYVCQRGSTIRFNGKDSYNLRKKAELEHECTVVRVVENCKTTREVYPSE